MSTIHQILGGRSGVTAPPPPSTNPETSLLLHLDTDFSDATGKIPTVGAVIATSPNKFGGGAAAFTGSGSNVTYPSSAAFAYGTGNFTWELWYLTNNTTSNKYLIDHGNGNSGTLVCPGLTPRYYNGTVGVVNFSANITTGVWNHIAVSRSSNLTRLFLNGVLAGSVTDTHNYPSARFMLGNFAGDTSLGAFGNIDEVRITKGVAL
ncbi:MAG: LamG-like jellyroll fold domain-containing protein, partial [Thiotrichaceae bacterium]